ncbi:hypothetical protein BKA80DRAFT_340770 [Phyllosticta citrichinensis]
MRSSRRPEQEGSSPTQPRQSRSNGVRGTHSSTNSYGAYDGDGDEGATISQNMHAMARAIETRAIADIEYFNGLRNSISEDKRKNLEAIAEWEKQTATADNGYLERLREPLTTAMKPPVISGRAQKRPSSGAETVGAADNPKKWKASSADTLAVSRELLHDYDLIERRLQHSTKGVSKKRLGRSWQTDADEAKRLVGIGYEKARREVVDVIRGSMKSEGATQDDDKEARAHFPGRGGGDRAAAAAAADGSIYQTLDEAERGVRRLTRSVADVVGSAPGPSG